MVEMPAAVDSTPAAALSSSDVDRMVTPRVLAKSSSRTAVSSAADGPPACSSAEMGSMTTERALCSSMSRAIRRPYDSHD
jgi:hypothetical protein